MPTAEPASFDVSSNRGNRLKPSRFSRIYYHLKSLEAAYIKAIDRFLSNASRSVLVDHGCGNLPYKPLFEGHIDEYLACDLPNNPLANRTIGDDGRLPVEDETADVVLSSQVLEHVTDPQKYLAESHRVLNSNGWLLLSTHGVWKYHPDPTDFWRWTSAGLRKQIEAADFEIVEMRGIMGPGATATQLFQDATAGFLPGFLRPLYYGGCQIVMGILDRLQKRATIDADACVYLVVARRK